MSRPDVRDGGQWSASEERAALRALEMGQEGAGIIDIGESPHDQVPRKSPSK
jgi:dihydropteroate synthase